MFIYGDMTISWRSKEQTLIVTSSNYAITSSNYAIVWRSKEQTLIVTFSNYAIDAEVIALHEESRVCVWLRSVT